MIDSYDDGRSRSFYCRAAALLEVSSLKASLVKAGQKSVTSKNRQNDKKSKAFILRATLTEAALEEGVELSSGR